MSAMTSSPFPSPPDRDAQSNPREQNEKPPRKRIYARKLESGQNIYDNFQWSPAQVSADGTTRNAPGKRPYDWTPLKSRELIKFIIHTDLKFDDISTAMKDDSGEGPCESTCRNHWHELFGYSPDLARLKTREGRERRLQKHIQAFEAWKRRNEALVGLDENCAPSGDDADQADSSGPQSSSSSLRCVDSVVQMDQHGDIRQQDDDQYPTMTIGHEPDSSSVYYPSPDAFASRKPHGRLPSLTEGKSVDNYAVGQSQSATPSGPAEDKSLPPTDPVAALENKEDLPRGFIGWVKRWSISSSLLVNILKCDPTTHDPVQYADLMHRSPSTRHASSASYAPSRAPSGRSQFPRSTLGSTATGGLSTQDAVPQDAICRYLEACTATKDIPLWHIENLIQRGASVNACNSKGETPLHLAVGLGNIVVFSLLVKQGADTKARTFDGESIWAYGGKVSKETLDPDKSFDDKQEQLMREQICAHIEFLRATAKFNPKLIVEEANKSKRRRADEERGHRSQAWSRSGASGKKQKSQAASSAASSKSSHVQGARDSGEPGIKSLRRSQTAPVSGWVGSETANTVAALSSDEFGANPTTRASTNSSRDGSITGARRISSIPPEVTIEPRALAGVHEAEQTHTRRNQMPPPAGHPSSSDPDLSAWTFAATRSRPHPRFLNMSSNNFGLNPENSTQPTPQPQFLDMSSNDFGMIPENPTQLTPQPQFLDMSSNDFGTIPEDPDLFLPSGSGYPDSFTATSYGGPSDVSAANQGAPQTDTASYGLHEGYLPCDAPQTFFTDPTQFSLEQAQIARQQQEEADRWGKQFDLQKQMYEAEMATLRAEILHLQSQPIYCDSSTTWMPEDGT